MKCSIVLIVITSLIPIDGVNIDDGIISFTDDDVTSLTYIMTEMKQIRNIKLR